MEEIKEMARDITKVLVALGKIETELKQLVNLPDKVDAMSIAIVGLERDVKALTNDVENIKADVSALESRYENERKAGKEDRKWLLGFLVAAITFLWKVADELTK
jgi:predicted  nucleic acid-binding Zn-ribbon protein